MNKRNFLKNSLRIGLGIIINSKVKAEKEIGDKIKDEVDKILVFENQKKLEKSISIIGQREVDFFISFFELKNQNLDQLAINFNQKVLNLQKQFGFSEKQQDGILGTNTLKQIYIEIYSKNLDKLDNERKKRLEIYFEMLGYSKYKKALYKKLNVFNFETYFGKDAGLNKPGTFINENLDGKIPNKINGDKNQIIIGKIDNKNYLAFYLNNNLYIATYVSPGLLSKKTPKLRTYGKLNPDKYHFSSQYPEPKNNNGIKGGAIMPYAVHIDGAIWIHGSDSNINGFPASNGCIRVPLYYMKEIHDKVLEIGIKNIIIDTFNIY